MWKIILSVCVLFFAVDVTPQIPPQLSQIMDYLNNVTVSDLANMLRWLPIPNPLIFDGQPVQPNDVMFYLYTRRNPDIPELLKGSSTRFMNLNPNHEVKFIVHGWIEDANRTYVRGLINAYLRRGEYNVIGVNWQTPAANEYTVSSRNTKTSGRALGDFIIRLNKLAGISYKQVHILGHSLGAHLSGFAGKRIQQRTGHKIGRITALDAAGPLFEMPILVQRYNRLDSRDAEFVDCIHTDGGIFGMTAAVCHVDFFPNGGVPRQPGCSMLNIQELSSRVIIDDMFCSHYRSHELYAESINSDKFTSTKCDSFENFSGGFCNGRSTAQMGEYTPATTRGKFYLITNGSPPYARS